MTSSSTTARHLKYLALVSPAVRIATRVVLHALSSLPQFDSSAADAGPLLRWDAFHFAHIAQHGYVHEYEWAFLPGIALAMRLGAQPIALLRAALGAAAPPGARMADLLNGGALLALLCDPTPTLYRLTLHHLGSPHLALLAAVLSLLPSSPATLHAAPYSEPFYTFLSYKGMLACARAEWLPAALWFALAACFRSNGLLLGGFLVWGLLVQPFVAHKRIPLRTIPYTLLLAALPCAPFAYHNHAAYTAYCLPLSPSPSTSPLSLSLSAKSNPTPIPSWCAHTLPSIYTHVQAKYWHTGFLAYWAPAQLPNFAIGAPVYALVLGFSAWHLAGALGGQVRAAWARLAASGDGDGERDGAVLEPKKKPTAVNANTSTNADANADPFLSPALTPHALHALFLTLTILLTAHVQIVLRQAASLPLVYWAAAWLFAGGARVDADADADADGGGGGGGGGKKAGAKEQELGGGRARWGRAWVGWSAVWGVVSLVLWAAFLPPA